MVPVFDEELDALPLLAGAEAEEVDAELEAAAVALEPEPEGAGVEEAAAPVQPATVGTVI